MKGKNMIVNSYSRADNSRFKGRYSYLVSENFSNADLAKLGTEISSLKPSEKVGLLPIFDKEKLLSILIVTKNEFEELMEEFTTNSKVASLFRNIHCNDSTINLSGDAKEREIKKLFLSANSPEKIEKGLTLLNINSMQKTSNKVKPENIFEDFEKLKDAIKNEFLS